MVNQSEIPDIRRVLIYKRTHEGDPDPEQGVFGNNGCMGCIRSWSYDAVIGVGGVRPWPKYRGKTQLDRNLAEQGWTDEE